MIFQDGIPRDTGATDFEDSARLVGFMCAVEFPGWRSLPVDRFVVDGKYVRHPFGQNTYDFSRDQLTCLATAFYKHGRYDLVNRDFITGKDFLSPSVVGHLERCQGKPSSWLQNMCLDADILWAAKVKPKDEINQLLCMLLVADPSFLRKFCNLHSGWLDNLREYWCGWRAEPELFVHAMSFIKERIR